MISKVKQDPILIVYFTNEDSIISNNIAYGLF